MRTTALPRTAASPRPRERKRAGGGALGNLSGRQGVHPGAGPHGGPSFQAGKHESEASMTQPAEKPPCGLSVVRKACVHTRCRMEASCTPTAISNEAKWQWRKVIATWLDVLLFTQYGYSVACTPEAIVW